MQIPMPKAVQAILHELNTNGYEAFIVGGCVRDSLLGTKPHDWDITTSAMPEEVKSLFRRTIDTGIEHGTVTIMVDKEGYEVTTYRVDGEYRDHRRPESVAFTRSLEEDLKRRDFTINAMAYNEERGLVDIYHGEEDLKKGVIRCVGNPDERFDEDALRILRAVRFAAKLGFAIDEDTKKAMTKHASDLSVISAERIREELTKLITSPNPQMLEVAYELGLTKVFLPEFDAMMECGQNNKHHRYDVGHHTLKVMEYVPAEVALRYTALLHDIGKPRCKTTSEDGVDHFWGHNEIGADMAVKILRRLKFDNDTIKLVKLLVLYHDYGIGGNVTIRKFRHMLGELGKEHFEEFTKIRYADMMGQSEYQRELKEASLEHLKAMFATVQTEQQCICLKEMKITGKDLIALGMKPGPGIGEILKELLEEVVNDPKKNNEAYLKERAAILIEAYQTR